MALSALLVAVGYQVRATARGQQTPAAPQAQASGSGQAAPQRGGRFDGPGGQFPGRGGPPPNMSPISIQWMWWKDDDVKKEVGLKPDQVARIDQYYSRRMKEIDPVAQEFQKEQDALDKMFADRVVDEGTIGLEMTKYYALRTSVNQSRYLMLYRIARVLDVDQYAKLKAIFARRAKDAEAHRGRGGTSEAPLGFRR